MGTNRWEKRPPPVPPACPAGTCVESPEEDLLREVRLADVIRCRGTGLL